MRTGAEYRDALRDGRRIWILGEGRKHFDPAWQDILLTSCDGTPVGYLVPRCAEDLTQMGRCFTKTIFLTAGNITHTPAYGHMIALGIRSALLQMAWDHVGSALDHRESVYELHANGGLPAWRNRLRRNYNRYEELANGVLRQLGLPMPKVDLSSIREAPMVARRPVIPPTPNA